MKYIINSLGQLILMMVLVNVGLLLVPRSVRRLITGTFKTAYKVTNFVTIQLKKVVKNMYANYKEIEQPEKVKAKTETKTKKSQSQSKVKSNVIQFPRANVK